MATRGKKEHAPSRPPAATPQEQENRMVALATNLAERQLKDGSASAAVITHYLKLATEKEKLERDKLRAENKLAEAKVQQIKSQERTEELFSEAIKAMTTYGGHLNNHDE